MFSWVFNISRVEESPASLDSIFTITPTFFSWCLRRIYCSSACAHWLGTTRRIMSPSSTYLPVFLCTTVHWSWTCSSWSSIINQFSWNSACSMTTSQGILPIRPLSRPICPPELQGYVPVWPLLSWAWTPPSHSPKWIIIPDIFVLPVGSQLCLCMQIPNSCCFHPVTHVLFTLEMLPALLASQKGSRNAALSALLCATLPVLLKKI